MTYSLIKPYSDELIELLKPYCTRIEIAGSIRRQVEECKDIEIVCIADKYKLEEYFKIHRPDNIFMYKSGAKYKRFRYKSVYVDLFICNEKNWGYIHMLRTGSSKFNIRLINVLKNAGYYCDDGYIHNGDTHDKIETPDEESIFLLIKKPFIEPQNRSWL